MLQQLAVTNLPPCLFDHTPPGVFDGQVRRAAACARSSDALVSHGIVLRDTYSGARKATGKRGSDAEAPMVGAWGVAPSVSGPRVYAGRGYRDVRLCQSQ